MFLLEGDSLLLHCFSDSRLDFDSKDLLHAMYQDIVSTDNPLSVAGFQILHAVYAVEHFLQGLVQRHCNFHVVFFEANRALCVPRGVSQNRRSKYFLARTIIQRHLAVNLVHSHPSIKTKTFDSAQDAAFQTYLEATGVYFVMCHDGANVNSLSVDKSLGENTDAQNALTTAEAYRKTKFRAIICSMMNRGYNIALINGLEFVDTKVENGFLLAISANDPVDFDNGGRRLTQSTHAGNYRTVQ